VPDWSGGTRIGEALKAFNFDWGRRVLGHGAVALLISDGWDRGDVDVLRTEMARLQRNCHRLIWLNPLLGSPQYEPLTRGMQAHSLTSTTSCRFTIWRVLKTWRDDYQRSITGRRCGGRK
jgi:uncharacterized protein with von Willebrand factor type A (vWA) domain